MRVNIIETDILIIGGGMAAARAAIAAADAGVEVVLVSKAPVGKSGASPMAQGGIAAPLNPFDGPTNYFEDIVAGGRGLTDPELARTLAEDAAARALELESFGVPFLRKDDKLALRGHLPGHAHPRVLNASAGGVSFMNPLRRKILEYPNAHVHDDTMATRLLTEERQGGQRVAGALCLDLISGEFVAVTAGATVIATGGYQELYPLSGASSEMTGDGYALAYEAGAELVDMEILLFYPTTIINPSSARGTIVIYETFLQSRVIGARLVNIDGEDLLQDRDYESLAVRDVLSRRIFEAAARGKGTERGGVFMDVSRSRVPLEERRERVKQAVSYERLTALGFDVATSKFEVAPSSHTVLGGIRINVRCETSVPGLYAAGEAAGNVHGANRLAGNALTETQVFGYRAGKFAAEFARQNGRPRIADEKIREAARPALAVVEPKAGPADGKDPLEIKREIQRTMFQYVGPSRSEESLTTALDVIERILAEDAPRLQARTEPRAYNYALAEALEVGFMARTAALVCHAARLRRESRGHHYRSDFPVPDESRAPYHTLIYQGNGAVATKTYPVS